MEKQEILVALTARDSNALGKIWRNHGEEERFLPPNRCHPPHDAMPMAGTAISLALTAPHPGA
jgi:hypothetical protein